MPKTSKRVANTPTSPIRRLVPFAEAAKKRGVQVFHLNIGQPDIETPKTGVKALQEADLGVIAVEWSLKRCYLPIFLMALSSCLPWLSINA